MAFHIFPGNISLPNQKRMKEDHYEKADFLWRERTLLIDQIIFISNSNLPFWEDTLSCFVLRLTFFSFSFHNCLSLFRFSLSIPSFWLRLFRQYLIFQNYVPRSLSLPVLSCYLIIFSAFSLFSCFVVDIKRNIHFIMLKSIPRKL